MGDAAPLESGWNDIHAASLDEPGRLLYRSNLLGSSAKGNEALQSLLADRDISAGTSLPSRLESTIAFLRTSGANHTDYVTRAWADDPIRDVLERMPGYTRTPPTKRTDARRDPVR